MLLSKISRSLSHRHQRHLATCPHNRSICPFLSLFHFCMRNECDSPQDEMRNCRSTKSLFFLVRIYCMASRRRSSVSRLCGFFAFSTPFFALSYSSSAKQELTIGKNVNCFQTQHTEIAFKKSQKHNEAFEEDFGDIHSHINATTKSYMIFMSFFAALCASFAFILFDTFIHLMQSIRHKWMRKAIAEEER